jgi:hypothetical protein
MSFGEHLRKLREGADQAGEEPVPPKKPGRRPK